MNPFELHGIDHLSPSSLNSYATAPALWVMERLLKRWSPTSAAASRGLAVEHGVQEALANGVDAETCVAAALAEYDRRMALNSDSKREDERAAIPGYVAGVLETLKPYGTPTSYQERIEITLPDVPVPVMGFIDWTFEQHGLIVDLKTTGKLPSSISTTHARQGAVYHHAKSNFGMRFIYVKPSAGRDGRAAAVYELEPATAAQHLEALRQIAIRMGRFLALSKDPLELAGLLVPDVDHFYYNNPATRQAVTEIYGF